jgi:hypothetical protein
MITALGWITIPFKGCYYIPNTIRTKTREDEVPVRFKES